MEVPPPVKEAAEELVKAADVCQSIKVRIEAYERAKNDAYDQIKPNSPDIPFLPVEGEDGRVGHVLMDTIIRAVGERKQRKAHLERTQGLLALCYPSPEDLQHQKAAAQEAYQLAYNKFQAAITEWEVI